MNVYYNHLKYLNCKNSWFFPVVNEEEIGIGPLRELLGLVVPNMTT